jgi:hypothetical protein
MEKLACQIYQYSHIRGGDRNLGLLTYIKDFLGIGAPATEEIPTEEFFNIVTEIHIRELAFYSCVNMIASAFQNVSSKHLLKIKK